MSALKDVWMRSPTDGAPSWSISMRCNTSREVTGVESIVINKSTLPPIVTERVKLDLDMARELKLQEDHFVLYGFSSEDLALLAEQIVANLISSGEADKVNLSLQWKRVRK